MARNGSGTYSLPTPPVVNGTTIDPNDENTLRSDIATALTQSIASDGQTVPTANLPMGGFKHTGMGAGSSLTDSATFGQSINAPAATTLASAATVNIGAALTTNIIISGTTTITAFDTVADGTKRDVTFSGALLLTHNATSLILPGAANITIGAGDCATFVSLGSGNWRCVKFQPATYYGKFVQRTECTPRTAYGTSSQIISNDDTIPQITEGSEWLSFTHTPKNATNRLVIRAAFPFSVSGNITATMAIFNGGSDAIKAMQAVGIAADNMVMATIEHEMAAGTTSTITFSMRAGVTTGTLYVLGTTGGRKLGGALAITMSVEEFAV